MTDKRYSHISITPNFYQLGTPSFPAYLSLGDDGMIIEGGRGATFAIIINRLKELGIEPERIKYLFLTHTHADHIGAIPRLRRIWPHLKVVASPVGEKLLTRLVTKEEALKEFLELDRSIIRIMLSKGEIDAVPPSWIAIPLAWIWWLRRVTGLTSAQEYRGLSMIPRGIRRVISPCTMKGGGTGHRRRHRTLGARKGYFLAQLLQLS